MSKQSKSPANSDQKKTYLCIEDGEQFTVEADSIGQAEKFAALYGGYVVRELTQATA